MKHIISLLHAHTGRQTQSFNPIRDSQVIKYLPLTLFSMLGISLFVQIGKKQMQYPSLLTGNAKLLLLFGTDLLFGCIQCALENQFCSPPLPLSYRCGKHL